MPDKPSLKNRISTFFTESWSKLKGVFSFINQKTLSLHYEDKGSLDEFCDYANNPLNFASGSEIEKARQECADLIVAGDFDTERTLADGEKVPAFTGDKDDVAAVAKYVNQYLLKTMLASDANVARRTAEFLSAQTRTFAILLENEDENTSLIKTDTDGKIIGGKLAPAVARLNALESEMPVAMDLSSAVKEIELRRFVKREMKDRKTRLAKLAKLEKQIKAYNAQIATMESASEDYKNCNKQNEGMENSNTSLDNHIETCETKINGTDATNEYDAIWSSEPWTSTLNGAKTQTALQKVFDSLAQGSIHALYDSSTHTLTDTQFDVPTPWQLAELIANTDKSFVFIKNNISYASDIEEYKSETEPMGFMLLTKAQIKFLDNAFKEAVKNSSFDGRGYKSFSDAGIATKFKFYHEMLELAESINWNDENAVTTAEKTHRGITQFYSDDKVISHIMGVSNQVDDSGNPIENEFRKTLAGAIALRTVVKVKQHMEKQKQTNASKTKSNKAKIEQLKVKFAHALIEAQMLQTEIKYTFEQATEFETSEPDYFGKRAALEDRGLRKTPLHQCVEEINNKKVSANTVTIDSDKAVIASLHQANSEAEINSCFNANNGYRKSTAKTIQELSEALAEVKVKRLNGDVSKEEYAQEVDAILNDIETKVGRSDPMIKKLHAHVEAVKQLVDEVNRQILAGNQKAADIKAEEARKAMEEADSSDADTDTTTPKKPFTDEWD